jgi:hypothetical protein
MTAKEKLHQVIDALTELEAERMLDVIARRRERDPVIAAFEDAPIDDEPTTPEEDRIAAEAWEQRHDSVPLEEFMREFD